MQNHYLMKNIFVTAISTVLLLGVLGNHYYKSENASHIDLYDKRVYLEQTVEQTNRFYKD